MFGTLRRCGQWDGKHSNSGVTTSLALSGSRAESPTTCGAFESTGASRSAVSVPGAMLISPTDGRLFAEGLIVMTDVEGGPPEAEANWRRVADTLRHLHRLTQGWPQRPGWRSSNDLVHAQTGTRI